MQLMPGTARGLGVKDIWDPWQNVLGGAKYLDQQLDRFGGNEELALSAYNSGPGGSESQGRIEAYPETQAYVKRVLAYEKQFQDLDQGAAPMSGAMVDSTPPDQANVDQAMTQAMGGPGFGPLAIQYEKPLEMIGGVGPISQRVGMEGSQEAMAPGMIPQSLGDAQRMAGLNPTQQQPIPSTDSGGSSDQQAASGTSDPAALASTGGLNAEFMKRFSALQAAVREAGGDLTIYSGARDFNRQEQLWNDALKKYGSESEARKWVAPPGKSNHDPTRGRILGFGDGALASDLRGDLALAHKLAPQFGLSFPLANEAWHIELAGIRDMKR